MSGEAEAEGIPPPLPEEDQAAPDDEPAKEGIEGGEGGYPGASGEPPPEPAQLSNNVAEEGQELKAGGESDEKLELGIEGQVPGGESDVNLEGQVVQGPDGQPVPESSSADGAGAGDVEIADILTSDGAGAGDVDVADLLTTLPTSTADLPVGNAAEGGVFMDEVLLARSDLSLAVGTAIAVDKSRNIFKRGLGAPVGEKVRTEEGAIEGEGMFPNDSIMSENISELAHRSRIGMEEAHEAPSRITEALERQLNEALARCRLIEEDRDQLERQVRDLRLKADLEAQARQQAEVAREAAEEELRYRLTVQDKTDSHAHSRIAALEAVVRELQGQLEDIEEQEGVVADLKERVQRAERQVADKDAHFERLQSDLERRLTQQQQLISKNRHYMDAVGRRKLLASNTLNNALTEMRSKRKEADQSVETLEVFFFY